MTLEMMMAQNGTLRWDVFTCSTDNHEEIRWRLTRGWEPFAVSSDMIWFRRDTERRRWDEEHGSQSRESGAPEAEETETASGATTKGEQP